MPPAGPDQDAVAAHAFLDRRGRRRVADLDPDREPDAAHVHDARVIADDGPDAGPQRLARRRRSLEHALVVEHVEHRQGRGRGHRVAAERAEEHGLVGEPRRDLAPGHDRADRVAVAHRLAERHEVGRDPEPLERPHRAGPAMTALHLVGDPQATGRVGPVEPVGRQLGSRVEEPVAGEQAVEDRGGRRTPAGGQVGRAPPRSSRRRGRSRGRGPAAPTSPRGRAAGSPATTRATAPRSRRSRRGRRTPCTAPPSVPVNVVASRHATSLASEPELTKSTVSRPDPAGIVAMSRSASSIAVSWR